MIEARILNNTIPSDVTQFSEIVDEYATFQRDKPNALYFYEGMIDFTIWLKKQFIDRDVNDFIIAGLFDNNRLIQILVGYKIEVAWNKTTIEDTFPFYVIALMYFRDKEWRIPGLTIDNLDKIITGHFEKQGYTKGFMTIKAPNFIIKNTNAADINKYINEVFIKTFYGNAHDYHVEHVFRTPDDLNSYKFKAFRTLLPKKLKRPIALLTFEIKPEIKKI
jgi:hypothetical protein